MSEDDDSPVRAGTPRAASQYWALFVLALSAAMHSASAFADDARPPNIVVFLADDLGFSDSEPYGSEVSTPAVSELAESGVTFTNHHTAASCAPTRGMLLTGVDSHRNGVPNIPESIPREQAEHDNYRGTLSHRVVTIATLLRDAGYHTYMTGKWHLGKSSDLLPVNRGFERTISMADTGSDNWEQKPYLPMYKKANWFEDGEELTLPEDYYSSRYLIDKMIEFIESNRDDGKPFFSYVPFLAVHMPLQAPQSFIDKYLGEYGAGWGALRDERLRRAKSLGIVPEDATLASVRGAPRWDALSADEKAYAAKKMAVYAGMIEAMDHHMGRLIDYIREIGEYDNTVFVFMSDNGPEASDVLEGWRGLYLKGWFRAHGYNTDYDKLGSKGSFVALGTGFGISAASPLSYYKWFAHEGGMRVPLIISGPGFVQGRVNRAFTYVTDLAPTILDIAGVEPPQGTYAGRDVETMRGTSLVPVLSGTATRVHAPDEPIGYELGGNAALFKGDFKIVMDRGPTGDGEWHLFNYATDPAEARDLRDELPDLYEHMRDDYRRYAEVNRVLPVPDGYDQRTEVVFYILRNNPNYAVLTTAGVLALLLVFFAWRIGRWSWARLRS